MKDDNAPLSTFGLQPGAKLMLVGTKPDVSVTLLPSCLLFFFFFWLAQTFSLPPSNYQDQEVLTTTTSGNPEEHALLTRISAPLRKATDVLLPQIDAYETAAANPPDPADAAGRKKLTDTHNKLSEQLMQQLLTLDGIAFPPEFETARQKRREAVRAVQGYLDRLDRITAKLKNGGAAAGSTKEEEENGSGV